MKKAKPAVIFLLKFLVSAGLLIYFLSQIEIKKFLQILVSADFVYVALALLVYLVSQFISAIRWTALARPLGFKTPFKDFIVYYLIGMFFNLFAPGTVGGDVSKVYYLARNGQEEQKNGWTATAVQSAISVFMDRAVGMVVLIWLGAIGLMLFPQFPVPATIKSLTWLLAFGFVVAGIFLPLLRRILPENGHPMLAKLRLALRSYRTHFLAVPQAVLLSFVIHLIQSWMHVVMGWALHLEIPFMFSVILYPLVGAFAALPVSLNGIGLREGGYMFMLSVIGVGSEKGIAFGLLLFLIIACDSLLGALVFLLKKSPTPSAIVAANEIQVK